MGEVVTLETDCPLCDGKGKFVFFNMRAIHQQERACSMCKGTGKRPSEAELAMRRQLPTSATHE